jgi:hypothetical protein
LHTRHDAHSTVCYFCLIPDSKCGGVSSGRFSHSFHFRFFCLLLYQVAYVNILNARARMCIRILVNLEILSQALLVISVHPKRLAWTSVVIALRTKVLRSIAFLPPISLTTSCAPYMWSILIIVVAFIVFSSITAGTRALPRQIRSEEEQNRSEVWVVTCTCTCQIYADPAVIGSTESCMLYCLITFNPSVQWNLSASETHPRSPTW